MQYESDDIELAKRIAAINPNGAVDQLYQAALFTALLLHPEQRRSDIIRNLLLEKIDSCIARALESLRSNSD